MPKKKKGTAAKLDITKRFKSSGGIHPEGEFTITDARYSMVKYGGKMSHLDPYPALCVQGKDAEGNKFGPSKKADTTIRYSAGKSKQVKPSKDGKFLVPQNDAVVGLPEGTNLDRFYTALAELGLDMGPVAEDCSTLAGLKVRMEYREEKREGLDNLIRYSIPIELLKVPSALSTEGDEEEGDEEDEGDEEEVEEGEEEGEDEEEDGEEDESEDEDEEDEDEEDDEEEDDEEEEDSTDSESVEDLVVGAINDIVTAAWDKNEKGVPITKLPALVGKALKKAGLDRKKLDEAADLVTVTRKTGEKFLKKKIVKEELWAEEEGVLYPVDDE